LQRSTISWHAVAEHRVEEATTIPDKTSLRDGILRILAVRVKLRVPYIFDWISRQSFVLLQLLLVVVVVVIVVVVVEVAVVAIVVVVVVVVLVVVVVARRCCRVVVVVVVVVGG
jgi:Flp pilus assembly protein TadB